MVNAGLTARSLGLALCMSLFTAAPSIGSTHQKGNPDQNAKKMDLLLKQAQQIYKGSGLKVPSKFVRYHEAYQKKRGKFKKFQARFNNLKAKGHQLRSQVIDFKNADAYTKVSMRCASDLRGLKAAAKKAKLNITNYLEKREQACQMAVFVAKLRKMYADWQVMKVEGFPLVQQYKKQTLKFQKRKRTTQLWADVRYMPEAKNLEYGVWFQWSDEKKNQLFPIPKSGPNKEGKCIPLSGRTNFCFKILDANTTSIKIDLWASVRYNKRTKNIGFGAQTIPAPFGYINQLEQMKENKKQQAVEKLTQKLAEIAGVNQQTINFIQTAASKK